MPVGPFSSFEECVQRMSSEPSIDDPEAFCGWLETQSATLANLKGNEKQMERKGLSGFAVKDEGQGKVLAVFATLNVIDLDGDVTLPGAFETGQAVKISSWGHNWGSWPVGKGVIGEQGNQAILDGQFFLDTEAGKEGFAALKALGSLVEWSYGFQVIDSMIEEREGRKVRVLKKVKVFEVSPVMAGAGIGTRTLAAKGQEPYASTLERVELDLKSIIERTRERVAIRGKDGRKLSADSRERLTRMMESMGGMARELQDMLAMMDEESGKAALAKLKASYLRQTHPIIS